MGNPKKLKKHQHDPLVIFCQSVNIEDSTLSHMSLSEMRKSNGYTLYKTNNCLVLPPFLSNPLPQPAVTHVPTIPARCSREDPRLSEERPRGDPRMPMPRRKCDLWRAQLLISCYLTNLEAWNL